MVDVCIRCILQLAFIRTPAWFRFVKKALLLNDGKSFEVRLRFETLTREIAAADLESYAKAVEVVHELSSFYIEDTPREFNPFSALSGKSETFWRKTSQG